MLDSRTVACPSLTCLPRTPKIEVVERRGQVQFQIRGSRFAVAPSDVLNATRGVPPKPVDGRNKYFVTLHERPYPIKQVLRLVTGLPWVGFSAQDAHRILSRLGFRIAERPAATAPPNAATPDRKRGGRPRLGTAVVDGAGDYRREGVRLLVVFETDEDGWEVASCPTLPGCHSQGRTREEALDNIREAIRGYLASLREHDAPLPRSTEFQVVEVRA